MCELIKILVVFLIFQTHSVSILFNLIGEITMATYECDQCGMAVNATCAKCDTPLVDDVLVLDDGSKVQISKCQNGHGKIKSPMCCGNDMSCPV